MDSEIEETHRQLRRSAALIQDAYQGLSTLHNRVSEASSIRAQSGSSPTTFPPAPVPSHLVTTGPVEERSRRSSMDPGHDVIVITSLGDITPVLDTSATPFPSSPTNGTSPRRGVTRPSDPTLASLRTELLASTQSVRERATELEDLRRSIFQYSQERNNPTAEGVSPSGTETAPRAQESSPTQPVPPSRRMVLEYSLRQRAAAESSATSLGMMVAARSASPPSNPSAPSQNTSSFSAPFPSAATIPVLTSFSTTRTPGAPIPSGIALRVTRLAQEIQQDIARITQQSESLMEWINVHRARLDAAAAARSSRSATSDVTARQASSSMPISTIPAFPTASAGLSVSAVPQPPAATRTETGETTRARDQVRRHREQAAEGRSTTQAIPIRPRRSPDGAVRARYLRQSVPNNLSMMFPTTTFREEPSSSWQSSGSVTSRAIPLPRMSPSTTITADAATSTGSFGDPEVIESIDRVRAALARTRSRGRRLDTDNADAEQSSSYVVRRRLNADGEEEVVRIAMRPESSPGFGETTERTREETDEAYDDEEDNDAWLDALSRLDAMSRQTAAREAASRGTRNAPSTSGWDLPPMTRGGTRMGTITSRTYSTGPYAINLPQRDARRWRDEALLSEDAEAEYERDLAAMRARARSLISSAASARTLGGTTLPPPPPTDSVRRTLFPTTSTQGTAGSSGSLWNDSSARGAFSRYQALFRETEPDRGSHTRGSLGVPSPSPPPERARRTRAADARGANSAQQPMWGSPTPFYPSPLPLPLVQDLGSLEVRSQAFAAPKVLARIPRRRGIAQAGC